jgi:hypothetical protein
VSGLAIWPRIPAVSLIGSRVMKNFVLLIGLLCCGCPATVGTNGAIYVPKDAAATCASHCNEIGLALNSVVIMASNVGCVCSAAPGAPGGGVSGGGMAALLMAEQQRRSAAATYQPHRPGCDEVPGLPAPTRCR